MRVRTVLFALLAGSTFASAQPGADLPPPDAEPLPVEAPPPPEPEPLPPPPAPAPVVVTPTAPGSAVPPITINITNNNTGNNSNTNTQTNSQANPQTNTQTATQTNTAPVTVTTTVAAPGAALPLPPVRAAVDHYELLRLTQKPAKWIALGVTSDLHGPPSGIRGSIDLIGRGAWTLGIAGAISHDGEHGHGRGGHGRPSASAVAYIAWMGKLGRFDLRAQIGLGAGTSAGTEQRGLDRATDTIQRTTTGGTMTDDDSPKGGHRLGMRAEAAVLVGLPLGKHLGVIAGPVVSAGKPEAGEKAVDAQLMAGLRYRF